MKDYGKAMCQTCGIEFKKKTAKQRFCTMDCSKHYKIVTYLRNVCKMKGMK